MKKALNNLEFTFQNFIKFWLASWKLTSVFLVLGLLASVAYVIYQGNSYTSSTTISVHNPAFNLGNAAASPYSPLVAIFSSEEAANLLEQNSNLSDVAPESINVTESQRSIFDVIVTDTDADKAKSVADAIASHAELIIETVYSDGADYEVTVLNRPTDAAPAVTTKQRTLTIAIGCLGGVALAAIFLFIRFDYIAKPRS